MLNSSNKSKKSKNIIIISIIVVLSFILVFFFFKSNKDFVYLDISNNSDDLIQMKAINSLGDKKLKAYKIPLSKLDDVQNILNKNQSSFYFEIELLDDIEFSEEDFLRIGLIYSSQKEGAKIKLDKDNLRDVVINCCLLNAPKSFCASIACDKRHTDILGIYIDCEYGFKLKNIYIKPTIIGFDRSGESPFYGFSSNGGTIFSSECSYDFTNASNVFDKTQAVQYVLKLSNKSVSTLVNDVTFDIYFGDERLKIKNVSNTNELIIPLNALKEPYSTVVMENGNDIVEGLYLESIGETINNDVIIPLRTDPGLILDYDMKKWRNNNFEIFKWDRFQNILFIDTNNYKTQSKFFARLAYFVEKKGFKGRVLTNEELKGKRGYNAHDYSCKAMADFYNKAYDNNIELTNEELILKKILLDNGFFELSQDKKHVIGYKGALASISRESSHWLRKLFLSHEGMHTLFFTQSDYRDYVNHVYNSISSKATNFIIDYFESQPQLGYDTKDEFLMKNEFMAYLMQQNVHSVPSYFVRLANNHVVFDYTPELSQYIITTNASQLEKAANMLNNYVFNNYGVLGGNLCLITK